MKKKSLGEIYEGLGVKGAARAAEATEKQVAAIYKAAKAIEENTGIEAESTVEGLGIYGADLKDCDSIEEAFKSVYKEECPMDDIELEDIANRNCKAGDILLKIINSEDKETAALDIALDIEDERAADAIDSILSTLGHYEKDGDRVSIHEELVASTYDQKKAFDKNIPHEVAKAIRGDAYSVELLLGAESEETEELKEAARVVFNGPADYDDLKNFKYNRNLLKEAVKKLIK